MSVRWSVTLVATKAGGGTVEIGCVDPADAANACDKLNHPTDWLALGPNSYTARTGTKSDEGWLLLRRCDLDIIDRNVATHKLKFQIVDGTNPTKSLQSLTIDQLIIGPTATCILPVKQASGVMSPGAIYLVQILDKRATARWETADVAFNVRCISGVASNAEVDYYDTTTNGGTPYTWQEAVDVLWDLMEDYLGTTPSLPFSPAHYPEAFEFRGVRAIDAVGVLLDRIGCTITRNVETGAFTIIRVGEQTGFTDLLDAGKPVELFDADPVEANYVKIPAQVRVHFRRQYEMYGGEFDPTASDDKRTGASFSIAITAASLGYTTTGVLAGTEEPLWAETTALFAPGGGAAPDNNSELNQVATEIAGVYYRRLLLSTHLARSYSGIEKFAPGGLCKSVRWIAGAGGSPITQISRYPGDVAGQMDDILHSATQPINLSRPSYPEIYPRGTVWVTIDGSTARNGDGYYSGLFVTIAPDGTIASGGGACWVRPTSDEDADWRDADFGGPWLGLLAGRAQSGGTWAPVVLVAPTPNGLKITTDGPVTGTANMRRITFPPELDAGAFSAGDQEVTFTFDHQYDEIEVQQNNSSIGTFHVIDFIDHTTISPSVVDAGGRVTVQMQLQGGPYVPESDVATAPAANKIMRADANGTHTFTPPAGNYAGLNVGSLAGDPANPAAGDIHYNSTAGRYKIYR